MLLTKRTSHLTAHAGPGRVSRRPDRARTTPRRRRRRCARRRRRSGWRRARSSCSGRLPDYVTGTGFRITPVLALLPDGLDADAQPGRGRGDLHAAAARPARPGGAGAAPRRVPRPRARVLGLAARRALYLGRDRRDPGAPGRTGCGREDARGGMIRLAELALFLAPLAAYVLWRVRAARAACPDRRRGCWR